MNDKTVLLKCSTCKKMKPTSEFHTANSYTRGYVYKCKSCVREYKRRPEVRARTNERERGYNRQKNLAKRRRRIDVIDRLGGKCACCGEERLEFLAIDHINGIEGKRTKLDQGCGLVAKVRKSNFDKKIYRVLCHNCNAAYGWYGYCPHQTSQTREGFLTREGIR